MKAALFVEAVEDMQSLKLSCLEEMAYRLGFIDKVQFRKNIEAYSKGSDYRAYLENILDDAEKI